MSVWELLVFATLLFLSGAFSGVETALTSLSRVRVRQLVEQYGARAAPLERWLAQPERYLTTLLICNNLVNVGSSAMATVLATRVLGSSQMGKAASLATGVMTLLILVFGEISPKHFCRRHAARIALLAIRPLHGLTLLLLPLEKLLSWISFGIVYVLSMGRIPPAGTFGEAELKAAVALSTEAGVIERDAQQMIHGVLEFTDTTVREIMVPRVRMTALEVGIDPDALRTLVLRTPFRRIPVYEGTRDQVLGILHLYDLLRAWTAGQQPDLRLLLLPVKFVPETKPVSEMLPFFQQEGTHLAMVINEYGGVEGLITLEDVLEEIVGEITDEHDRPSTRLRRIASGCFELDAGVEIKQAARALQTQFGETSAASVGGWLIEQLGHIPQVGESHQVDDLKFSVTEATGRAVKKIQVERVTRSG